VITTNLSTRPFYNERVVRVWLLVAALLVAALTLFNNSSVLYYSRLDTARESQIARDDAQARELRESAAKLRLGVNTAEIQAASVQAQLANSLIDRRTFSWTELFNRFEATLPADVRITSVRPKAETDRIILDVNVLARGVDDVDEFIQRLEATGAFVDPLSRSERVTESGQLEAQLDMVYLAAPPGGKP
jgi:hypothetical protein